ncbi:unnamed protein product, partial [Fusarium langsethiae]
EDVNATCKEFPESTLELKMYPDLNHFVVTEASQADYLPWIADRFNNVTLSKGCTRTVVTPATKKFGIVSQTWAATS